ncbi:MAG: hypothetical protein AAFY19_10120 [Pseudomonadota bacterium]
MKHEQDTKDASGRRKGDRRKAQEPYEGPDRRKSADRRSGEDRRATVRVPGTESEA